MGELTASLAHELSQPLTAIRSNAQAGSRMLGSPSSDSGRDPGHLRRHRRQRPTGQRNPQPHPQPGAQGRARAGAAGAERPGPRGCKSGGDGYRITGDDHDPGPGRRRPAGAGRPDSAPTGCAEPDPQRSRCHGRGTSEAPVGSRFRRCGTIPNRCNSRYAIRYRDRPRADGPHLRSILHVQARRPGHGPLDRADDRAGPRRTDMGGEQPRPWSQRGVRAAGGNYR